MAGLPALCTWVLVCCLLSAPVGCFVTLCVPNAASACCCSCPTFLIIVITGFTAKQMERLIVVLDENMDGEISVLEFLAQVDPRYGNYSALGVGDVNADLPQHVNLTPSCRCCH